MNLHQQLIILPVNYDADCVIDKITKPGILNPKEHQTHQIEEN
jgi:hypothetical protein